MERTIAVKGVGGAAAKPDYTVLALSIEAKDKDYDAAMEVASRKVNLLEAAAERIGFERGALKTVSFSVNIQYENVQEEDGNFRRVFAGYGCFYHLKLAFDFDRERLAAVLNAVSSSGANPDLNISFTVKDPAKVSDELLTSAAANARKKAEVLCRASGVALGQLISIDYNWDRLNIVSPTRYDLGDGIMPMMARKYLTLEIEPDDIDLQDTAAFVWEIK